MFLWDTHMHTNFSGDCKATPESMIEAARNAGLAGICFTDHMDYDYPGTPEAFLLDLPEYEKTMMRLRDEYEEVFPVLIGMEVGLQPHIAQKNNEFIASCDFDYIIGSSHVCGRKDPYYPEYFDGVEEKAAYRAYFEEILENVKTDVDFDVYGHLDYIVRYGPNKNRDYRYEDYADVIDEILRLLIEKGKGIELNTAGFKYGLGMAHPTPEILKRYRQLGGEIITIGADAHKPEHIAYDFEKVPEILKSAGFEYYTVFTSRVPSFYRIP